MVALDRAGFSPGEIDGRGGTKTRLALSAFQTANKLTSSGMPDEATLAALHVSPESIVSYTITQHDVAGPFIGSMPKDMMEAAKLPAFGYATPLEALAEKFHSSPAFLQRLNPGASWAAGDAIKVPGVEPFEPRTKADPAMRAAVLAWAVRGRSGWERQGIGNAPAVIKATEEIRQEMDPLREFWEDCCEFIDGEWTPSDVLHTRYKDWCEYRDQRPINETDFHKMLRGRKCVSVVKKFNGKSTRGWRNIRLNHA